MKRTYRIALFVEGTFARKVNAKAEAKRLLHALRVRDPWTQAGTRVSSKTIHEHTIAPKKPTEKERRMEEVLERARRVVAEVRQCTPTLPRVTVRWVYHDEGGCGTSSARPDTLHLHRGKWATRRPGAKKDVRLPRNLICLERGLLSNYAWTDEQFAHLMARSILQMYKKRVDRREVFLVMERWKAWKSGTFTPPQPRPPPKRL